MSLQDEFPEIARAGEPLAPYTWLKVGGPAEFFASPRDADELTRLIRHCHANQIPMHVLGGGGESARARRGREGRRDSPRQRSVPSDRN